MRTLSKWLYLSLVLGCTLVLSCENPAVETDADGRVRPAGLSFEYVTAANSSSSYTLRVNTDQWEQDGDFNIYRHPGGDDYEGLQVRTQDQPVDDLSFEMSKNNDSLENYLGVDGAWVAQILGIQLPFGMFTQGLGLAEGETIDYSNFEYKFRMADSDIEVDAIYEINEETNSVTVEISSRGAIIVRQKEEQQLASFTITGPDLEFRHYHQIDESLRTFTWENPDAHQASCSLDGGASFGQCTSQTSMLVEVDQFNTYPTLVVRLTNGTVSTEASFDLSDSEEGYTHATFYTCDQYFNPTVADIANIAILANDSVVCFQDEGGSYDASAMKELVFHANAKFIGDHDNPPIISSVETVFKVTMDSNVKTGLLFANMIFDISGSGKALHVVGEETKTAENASTHVFSNVEFVLNTTAAGRGIISSHGENIELYDVSADLRGDSSFYWGTSTTVSVFNSTFKQNASSDKDIFVLKDKKFPGTKDYFYKAEFENLSSDGNSLDLLHGTDIPTSATVEDSVFRAVGPAIATTTKLSVLELNRNEFRRTSVSGSPDRAISFNTNFVYELTQDQNHFCNESGEHAFSGAFANQGTGSNSNLSISWPTLIGLCTSN